MNEYIKISLHIDLIRQTQGDKHFYAESMHPKITCITVGEQWRWIDRHRKADHTCWKETLEERGMMKEGCNRRKEEEVTAAQASVIIFTFTFPELTPSVLLPDGLSSPLLHFPLTCFSFVIPSVFWLTPLVTCILLTSCLYSLFSPLMFLCTP